MQFKSLALYLGVAIAVVAPCTLAAPSSGSKRLCKNTATAPAHVEQSLGLKIAEAQSSRASAAAVSASIPVYYHVITDGSKGKISSSQINSQISVMNSAYQGTGLSFYLAGSDTTTNSNWFNNVDYGTSAERSMKSSLKKGGANALNVYTVNFSDGTLGYGKLRSLLWFFFSLLAAFAVHSACNPPKADTFFLSIPLPSFSSATFPWDYNSNPSNDGVVLFYQAAYPGGPLSAFAGGKTLVHEAGHWAGLYHVFQGGCSGSGDYVDDTPPQSTATSGCPSNQDSCAGGGPDSVHNYMDYSDDNCLTGFTSGQITRMSSAMSSYRL